MTAIPEALLVVNQSKVYGDIAVNRDVAEFPSPAESAESVQLLLTYMDIAQVTGGIHGNPSNLQRNP